MDVYFFPRDKSFWIYHCSVLTLLSSLQLIAFILWRDDIWFNICGGLLWLPLFTLSVLYFRKLYKTWQWKSLSIIKTIPVVMAYCAVAGFVVAVVMLGIIIPAFSHEMLKSEFFQGDSKKLTQHIISMVISNWFVTQLVIGAWISMYMGITSSKRVKETELINLRLQNSLREAQLSSLANQLNPHFLFNALNNIRFIIHENSQRSDQVITELSELLRYSLQTSQKEKVILRDEIAVIAQYIDIVKIQLEERLMFSMHIPAQMNDYLVPPMMLQMLVENAIKHGIDNLHQGGRLHILAEEETQHIVFNLTNDSAAAGNPLQTSMGIGLNNIKQRLKLLYGDNAALAVAVTEEEEQGKFSVRIRLPKEAPL